MRAGGPRATLGRDAALGIGAVKEHRRIVRAVVRTLGLVVDRHPVVQRT